MSPELTLALRWELTLRAEERHVRYIRRMRDHAVVDVSPEEQEKFNRLAEMIRREFED